MCTHEIVTRCIHGTLPCDIYNRNGTKSAWELQYLHFYTSYYSLSPCSSPPVRMGILGATQIIYCLAHLFFRCFGSNAKGICARLSQHRCAFGHALWSIFKAWRAILLLDVHSSDSKMMRDELSCEIYACECLPRTFLAANRRSGRLSGPPGGYITIWVDF